MVICEKKITPSEKANKSHVDCIFANATDLLK